MLCSSNSSSLMKIARIKILLKMYYRRNIRITLLFLQRILEHYLTVFKFTGLKIFWPIKLKRNMVHMYKEVNLSTVTHHIPLINHYISLFKIRFKF